MTLSDVFHRKSHWNHPIEEVPELLEARGVTQTQWEATYDNCNTMWCEHLQTARNAWHPCMIPILSLIGVLAVFILISLYDFLNETLGFDLFYSTITLIVVIVYFVLFWKFFQLVDYKSPEHDKEGERQWLRVLQEERVRYKTLQHKFDVELHRVAVVSCKGRQMSVVGSMFFFCRLLLVSALLEFCLQIGVVLLYERIVFL